MSDWLNKLWQIHTIEYYSALTRNKLLIHALTWMNLQRIMIREKDPKPKSNNLWFYIYNILKMTKLPTWRIDLCFLGVKDGVGLGAREFFSLGGKNAAIKGQHEGSLRWWKCSVSPLYLSICWLWHHNIVLQDVIIRRN